MKALYALMTFSGVAAVTLMLAGCLPAAIGGAAAGGTVIAQERTAGDALDDKRITAQINHYYLQKDINHLFNAIDVDVNEGRVLLTGNVRTQDDAVEAVRLAWLPQGVKEVINELKVTESTTLKGYSQDVWITTQVRSKLLVDKYVKSVNYSVETSNGIVYLFGIAQDQQELDRVTSIASRVKGVRRVVSHVRLKEDPLRQ